MIIFHCACHSKHLINVYSLNNSIDRQLLIVGRGRKCREKNVESNHVGFKPFIAVTSGTNIGKSDSCFSTVCSVEYGNASRRQLTFVPVMEPEEKGAFDPKGRPPDCEDCFPVARI